MRCNYVISCGKLSSRIHLPCTFSSSKQQSISDVRNHPLSNSVVVGALTIVPLAPNDIHTVLLHPDLSPTTLILRQCSVLE